MNTKYHLNIKKANNIDSFFFLIINNISNFLLKQFHNPKSALNQPNHLSFHVMKAVQTKKKIHVLLDLCTSL